MKTGLKCLFYAGAIVLVAIGADRIGSRILYGNEAGPALAAGSYYHPTVRQKLDQVSDGAADGRDAFFIGNSLTMLGVDPASFDRRLTELGRPFSSYNLAIPSVGVTFWPEFFDRYWRRGMPRDLLLGVQPRDVDERGKLISQDRLDRFFDTRGSGNGIQTFAEDALSDAFTLYQRRGTLFAEEAEELPIGDEAGSTDIKVSGPQGFSHTGEPFVHSAAELRRDRRSARLAPPPGRLGPPLRLAVERLAALQPSAGRRLILSAVPILMGARPAPGLRFNLVRAIRRRYDGPAFAYQPGADAALEEIADQQETAGGRLILFTLPGLFDSEREGTPGVEYRFIREMRRFEAEHPGVVFVDAARKTASGFSASDYLDENHLNPPAARRFSATLAELLAPYL